MRRGGARYLAEDFGILARDGTAYLSPKSISIYATDLHSRSLPLSAYVDRLPIWLRSKWTVHNWFGTIPMVKAPVFQLLRADQIGSRATLRSCIYLVRTRDPGIRLRDATAADLARRLTHVAAREHKRLLEIVHLIRANADGEIVPGTDDLLAETSRILERALGQAACHIVEAPIDVDPDRLLAAIEESTDALHG
jgi:hypothetical protein